VVDQNLSSDELHSLALEHVWMHGGTSWDAAQQPGTIVVMERGEGVTVSDLNGKQYLDFASGLWLVNVGYGRSEIARAMAEQAERLHYTKHQWPTEPTIRLASRLAGLTPGNLNKVFFTGGGGEANEAALKIAAQYHRLNGEPQRTKFIGRDLSYHGASFATMSVGGSKQLNRHMFDPFLMPNAQLIAGPGHPQWSGAAAGELEQVILREGADTVAAFIGEPISNSAGIHVPADDYWPSVRAVCDKYGVLLICDEVITGFGRSGAMFGVQHWDITPDIMTVAKGLTSGYVPMGAAIATEQVAERFRPGPAEAFQHVITFGGQAVAAAAAMTNIDIIEREGLVARSAELGEYLIKSLDRLKAHGSVVETRGRGLMVALQIGRSPDPESPLTAEQKGAFAKKVYALTLERGLNLVGGAEKIAFMPPLVVQEEEIDRAVSILDQSLGDIEAECGWWK
jgi:adenosylmethionine-8-amino-7-oxononanoate aminotransferase